MDQYCLSASWSRAKAEMLLHDLLEGSYDGPQSGQMTMLGSNIASFFDLISN
jgi:hypothetical protein